MQFVVYILYSENYERIYIGYTSNLIQRFYSHNQFSKKGHTIRYRPWKVIYTEFFHTKQEATAREAALKSGQGRQWTKHKLELEYRSAGFISA